jgi:hypothetical protein
LVTTGSECIRAGKLFTYQQDRQCMFIMTSGLRSVRDKALTSQSRTAAHCVPLKI